MATTVYTDKVPQFNTKFTELVMQYNDDSLPKREDVEMFTADVREDMVVNHKKIRVQKSLTDFTKLRDSEILPKLISWKKEQDKLRFPILTGNGARGFSTLEIETAKLNEIGAKTFVASERQNATLTIQKYGDLNFKIFDVIDRAWNLDDRKEYASALILQLMEDLENTLVTPTQLEVLKPETNYQLFSDWLDKLNYYRLGKMDDNLADVTNAINELEFIRDETQAAINLFESGTWVFYLMSSFSRLTDVDSEMLMDEQFKSGLNQIAGYHPNQRIFQDFIWR